MKDGNALIESRRLYLRKLEESDVGEAYLGWMADSVVCRCLESRFTQHTVDSLRSYVRRMKDSSSDLFMAAVLKDGDRHIGNVRLGEINPHHRLANLGILIGVRDCWGCGYGSEIIGLATDYAFRVMGLRKLNAGVYKINSGSVKAFEKAGWTREAELKRQYLCEGKEVDEVIMGIHCDQVLGHV